MVWLLVAFYLLFPAAVIYGCIRFPLLDKIGFIILCYAAGLILGNAGLIPTDAGPIQDTICEATVALSLPLLLFSLDIRQWVGLAGKTLLSMVLAFFSVTFVACGTFFLIPGITDWKLTGMAISVYTGGTPNLAAVRTALAVDPDLYIAFHTYDIFVSLFCIVFFLTAAQKLFGLFLPRFTGKGRGGEAFGDMTPDHDEDINGFAKLLAPGVPKGILGAAALSCAIVGTALGAGLLVPRDQSTAVTILAITTLGIGASFIPRIRRIPHTFQAGMYLIMVFCLTVSSMSDLSSLMHVNPSLFSFVLICVFGSLLLHALLCRLFAVDTDTFIITSASAICSPPFVPVVAAALKNRAVIVSGLTTGIIGYALGNYLGITVAYIVKHLIQ